MRNERRPKRTRIPLARDRYFWWAPEESGLFRIESTCCGWSEWLMLTVSKLVFATARKYYRIRIVVYPYVASYIAISRMYVRTSGTYVL